MLNFYEFNTLKNIIFLAAHQNMVIHNYEQELEIISEVWSNLEYSFSKEDLEFVEDELSRFSEFDLKDLINFDEEMLRKNNVSETTIKILNEIFNSF